MFRKSTVVVTGNIEVRSVPYGDFSRIDADDVVDAYCSSLKFPFWVSMKSIGISITKSWAKSRR